jgi:DNA repair protein RadD
MLRDYQQHVFEKIKADIDVPGASVVVMPTGSGKSHLIAAAATLKQPVLILQPSVELVVQNRAKLAAIVPPEEIGVYSASFGTKDIRTYTFATIQSVYKKPELFRDVKLVIQDECHGVAVKSLGTMYKSFFKGMGGPKILGLTATPFRLEIGYRTLGGCVLEASTMLKMINRMRNKGETKMFWSRILGALPHRWLVDKGYLVPLEYIHEPLLPYQEIPVNISRSDYNLEKYTKAIVGREAQILETVREARDRYGSVLVFCSTVEQAERLSDTLVGSACVSGTTHKKVRERIIEQFKSGEVKVVFNVGVLTTGFDFPALSCVVLLRPTRSPILYQQMLGRLTRTAPGKEKGVVIDLCGACKAMGPIESFEVYQKDGWAWDLRSEGCESWHGRILFSQKIEK